METTIIVSYDAGWGSSLSIRGGEPLNWESGTRMESEGPHTWTLQLDLEDPLEFKPLLNDELWAFGHRDYRVEPGETVHLRPHFLPTPGWADAIGYIPFRGRDITVRLYTPPGYRENSQRRYPVVYCLDGQSLFEPQGAHADWHLDDHLNALIESRTVEPMLLVGVDFLEPGLSPESLDFEATAQQFGPFILKLKETIDRGYPTLPEPEQSVLVGAAWGGLFALKFGLEHPDRFGRLAALAPSFAWAGGEALAQAVPSSPLGSQKVYLDGTSPSPEGVEGLAGALRAAGWVEGETFDFEPIDPEGPRAVEWARRIGSPLRFLLPWSGR